MLTPEERAREEERARIQTQAQYDKGREVLGLQLKIVGFGCLGIIAMLAIGGILSSLTG